MRCSLKYEMGSIQNGRMRQNETNQVWNVCSFLFTNKTGPENKIHDSHRDSLEEMDEDIMLQIDVGSWSFFGSRSVLFWEARKRYWWDMSSLQAKIWATECRVYVRSQDCLLQFIPCPRNKQKCLFWPNTWARAEPGRRICLSLSTSSACGINRDLWHLAQVKLSLLPIDQPRAARALHSIFSLGHKSMCRTFICFLSWNQIPQLKLLSRCGVVGVKILEWVRGDQVWVKALEWVEKALSLTSVSFVFHGLAGSFAELCFASLFVTPIYI